MRVGSVGRAVLLALVLGCLVLAGCARSVGPGGSVTTGPTRPGSGTTNQSPHVSGPVGKFKVTGVIGHEIVPGSEIVFDFGDQLGIATGCNGMGGAYRIENDRLQVEDLAQTLMACAEPLMAQEQWIASFVTTKPDIHPTVTGWVLSGRGIVAESLTLEPVPAPAVSPLEGTQWRLTTIIDGSTASSVPAAVTAGMRINGGRISLAAGCNSISGSITVEAGSPATSGRLVIGPLISTKMFCEDPVNQVETALKQGFDGTVNYAITAERGLEITTANGRGLVFTPDSTGIDPPSPGPSQSAPKT